MFGLNEYYDSLLLEAKSPEEIKNILEYQFVGGKGVPEAIFSSAFNADPTKKKAYTRWLFSKWDDEKEYITQLAKSNEIKRLFDYFQERNNSGLSLASFKTVGDAVAMLPEVDKVLTKNGNGGPEDDYDIVYDTPEWKIAVPHTYPASEKLGKGCKWCTAGAFRNGESYFNDYTRSGPLWINYKMNCPEICPMDNKEYPYTRYQFCFETGDYRDCHDQMISSFSDIELPEDVKKFYAEQKESYGETIENDALSDEERFDQYMYARDELSQTVKEFDGEYLTLYPVWRDDYVADETDDYFLYDEEDCVDPISYKEIDKDNWFVKNYEGYSPVIVKDASDGQLFCYLEQNSYWNCVEDVDFIQDVGKFVVFAGSESDSNLCFFDLENNKISKLSIFKHSYAVDFHITLGLPIKGEEGKTFEPNNIFVEAILDNGRVTLVRLDTVNFQPSVVVEMDHLADDHFYVTFEEDEYGVPQPQICTQDYHYGMGYVGSGYHYSDNIDGTYVRVYKENDGYGYGSDNRLYNIYNNKTGNLLFKEPAKKLLALINGSPYYAYINDNCVFIYDLYKQKRVSDIYNELKARKYNNNYYVWLISNDKNNACYADVFTTDAKKIASFKNIVDTNEKLGIITTKDPATGKKTLIDFEGKKLFTGADKIKEMEGSVFYYISAGETNLLLNIRTGEIVDNELTGEYYAAKTSVLTKSNGNCLLIPFEYGTEKDDIYKVDKIVSENHDALFTMIQNRYFFFAGGKFFPEQGIDVNEVSGIEPGIGYHDGFYIKTKDNLTIHVGANANGLYDMTYPSTPEQKRAYDVLFGTGINEIKNKFYDIYNKIKYVWD